jgi:hypothetical protein
MAEEDKRYQVKVTLDIKDTTSGVPTPFFNVEVGYSDMPVTYMMEVERQLLNAFSELLGQGEAEAGVKSKK